MFQSTHPHGVRLNVRSPTTFNGFVSIHAPTRGATFSSRFSPYLDLGFNPRTHTGCDEPVVLDEHKDKVSIHAPTRGATLQDRILEIINSKFQSTHPHGVRLNSLSVLDPSFLFQSTHPHGVRQFDFASDVERRGFQSTHPHGVRRLRRHAKAAVNPSFNPRTHTGCDFSYRKEDHLLVPVSIHAPTRGATAIAAKISPDSCPVSIHAPTRGAT